MNHKEILIQLGLTGVVTFTIDFLTVFSYFQIYNMMIELYVIIYIDVALVPATFLILRCFTFLPESTQQNNNKVSLK